MNDIHDIRDVFLPVILSREVIITILVGILLFIMFLALHQLWGWLQKLRAKKAERVTLREGFVERINAIELHDPDFFKKISFYIRRYYEIIGEIHKGTKKTALEIKEVEKKERVYKCIDTCNLFEYTLKKATPQEKERIRNEAKELILS